MKLKKILFYRPEIGIEFKKPFLSRCYFAFIFPRFIKIGIANVRFEYNSKLMKNAGHTFNKKMWYIAIPKFKVVKGDDAE